MTGALPRVLFFNINGSGLGHLSRCLAYARRMQGRARCVFFSLASAIEIIHDMGFEADYFVSEFWSRSHINAWNRELAIRVGLLLEELQPDAVLFDGTWPFHGFMDACDTHKIPVRVWSSRGLHKAEFPPVPVPETAFDLVIRPGEVGTEFSVAHDRAPGRKITTPPVKLLRDDELLDRDAARDSLGLQQDGRYALLSLGPGNLKDLGDIAPAIIDAFRERGFEVIWAQAPITVRDVPLPDSVVPISEYPLVRYMRAFDAFAGAAGYNTCCEVIQSGIPSLLVPNKQVADDQLRRAEMVADVAPVVVSPCETDAERQESLEQLLALGNPQISRSREADGAQLAADEILSLVATTSRT
jgi:UDP:flavonoid glycosyltransferase YjiC (YdhE family)